MNEQDIAKLEAKLHNPRFANNHGQQACVTLAPGELSDLLRAARTVNAINEDRAKHFYPNRIRVNGAGEFEEERIAISEWPQWAQDAFDASNKR